jgi:hypothetical protein
MRNGMFFAPDGGAGSGTGSGGDGGQGGGAGAGAGSGAGAGTGGGGGQAADLATLNARLADLERQKSALEKDLHKEREGRKAKEAEAQTATDKAAAAQKAALDALRAAGIDVPGQDPATEVAAKLKAIEDEKRKKADEDREARIARLTIERELLKALAGKADDPDYALYKAVRTSAFSDVKVEGDRVSGIEAVVKELTEAGVLKTGKVEEGLKKTPPAGGQPPLQGDKYPWREAKTWQDFVKLPWATQQEAESKDPDFVNGLRKKFTAA